MLTEAQGKYLFTFTLQVFESKPHCVCTGICLRDGVGFTQPTHCISLLLEFIQRKLPILSDLQKARVCVIVAHQEQTIVFGCLLYLVYCALVVCILVCFCIMQQKRYFVWSSRIIRINKQRSGGGARTQNRLKCELIEKGTWK